MEPKQGTVTLNSANPREALKNWIEKNPTRKVVDHYFSAGMNQVHIMWEIIDPNKPSASGYETIVVTSGNLPGWLV
ncbi:hypothetical protein [Cohnella herbarum]|uniref:Uncharacterized protein n=1 Tax=Cohnella herbarum TaxID=2728023 RepID=A0A7Z2VQG9_9BACL|nr:hypothetical protein [Cohnella herbarum]QJD87596.1 hypothetical protein HH215_33390 [Cohnella herbarum]